MNRNTILLLGGGLISGLILWDRADSTDVYLPGTVQQVEERDLTEGPPTWHITAQSQLGTHALGALSAAPDLAAGDSICIHIRRRMARADSYFLAPATSDC